MHTPLKPAQFAGIIPAGYRPDIDGLRAVSILAVVWYHAFPDLVPGGFVGVDIFFVISGYLITTIIVGELSTNSFSILTFYQRRIRRIFPALIVVLAAAYAAGSNYWATTSWVAPSSSPISRSCAGRIILHRTLRPIRCFTSGRSGSRSNFIFSGRYCWLSCTACACG